MHEALSVMSREEPAELSAIGDGSAEEEVAGRELRLERAAAGCRSLGVSWVDDIYSGVRAEDEWLCVLVLMGVSECRLKRFLTIEDRVYESASELARGAAGAKGSRATEPPLLAVGDGALGF
jgi:putative transposase